MFINVTCWVGICFKEQFYILTNMFILLLSNMEEKKNVNSRLNTKLPSAPFSEVISYLILLKAN